MTDKIRIRVHIPDRNELKSEGLVKVQATIFQGKIQRYFSITKKALTILQENEGLELNGALHTTMVEL